MKLSICIGLFLVNSFFIAFNTSAQNWCSANQSSVTSSGSINATTTGGYPVSLVTPGVTGSGGINEYTRNVDIVASLAPGEIFYDCDLVITTGRFDDGFQVTLDGVPIVYFRQQHYDASLGAATTEFNGGGIFDLGGAGPAKWTPWSGEGNPQLVLSSSGTVVLLVTTILGTRIDALPFMDPTVPGFVLNTSFSYDCLTGLNIEFGNTNGSGNGSWKFGSLTTNLYVCNDTDDDGVNNISDIDSDNDGILDVSECSPNNSSLDLISAGATTSSSGTYPLSVTQPANSGSGSGVEVLSEIDFSVNLVGNDMFDHCDLIIDCGIFEQGLQLNIDAIPILYFDETHFSGVAEFGVGGLFDVSGAGGWTPSSGEGNPELIISPSQDIQLLLDDNLGGRQNALPFMTGLNLIVNSDFNLNCLEGSEVIFGNTVVNGNGSLSGASFTVLSFVCPDVDGDNIPNLLDLDSDDDGCFDVLEAIYIDQDLNGILGLDPTIVNTAGQVIGTTVINGYAGSTIQVTDGIPSIECLTVLPIELIGFEATSVSNRMVNLEWNTASEVNNDYFLLEKSANITDWDIVTTIPGMGTSTNLTNYDFNDEKSLPGISYYRLTQFDIDGASSVPLIRSVNNKHSELLQVYPNPSRGKVHLSGYSIQLKDIKLFNSLGQLVHPEIQFISDTKATLDISKLSAGIYMLESNNQFYTITKE